MTINTQHLGPLTVRRRKNINRVTLSAPGWKAKSLQARTRTVYLMTSKVDGARYIVKIGARCLGEMKRWETAGKYRKYLAPLLDYGTVYTNEGAYAWEIMAYVDVEHVVPSSMIPKAVRVIAALNLHDVRARGPRSSPSCNCGMVEGRFIIYDYAE